MVSNAEGSSGTWSGAVEALGRGWVPVVVRDDPGVPRGNRALIERGAGAVPADLPLESMDVATLVGLSRSPADRVAETAEPYVQDSLFFTERNA